MSRPDKCPQCGSVRLWNMRLARFLQAAVFAFLGAANAFQFATAGQRWLDAASGIAFVAAAVLFGLMAAQHPPWRCRGCSSRF